MRKKSCLSLLVLAMVVFTAGSLHATKLLHRNVAELATLADRIFVGVCLSVETKTLSIEGQSLQITEYTFEVSQGIKGVTGSTLVFRQFGPTEGSGSVVGMPSYRLGKTYMLFLRADSKYGLTSPIGFGQGAFLVIAGNNGTTQAINTFGNRGLFQRVQTGAPIAKITTLNKAQQGMLQKKAGPLDLEDFIVLVKKLVE
jgi:hypothetical protein